MTIKEAGYVYLKSNTGKVHVFQRVFGDVCLIGDYGDLIFMENVSIDDDINSLIDTLKPEYRDGAKVSADRNSI